MSPSMFVEHGDEILDLAPIEEVSIEAWHDGGPTPRWTDVLPELLSASALPRVRHLSLGGNLLLDFVAMQQIIRAPNLDSLIKLTTSQAFSPRREELHAHADEEDMWELLFASPTFRRLVDWGLGLLPHQLPPKFERPYWAASTHRQVGDRILKDRPESDYYLVTSYTPMPAEDRALEERYGYIPRLHAANWAATVLDVLRGVKPDFPVGARPTEAMYAVPPTTNVKDLSDH